MAVGCDPRGLRGGVAGFRAEKPSEMVSRPQQTGGVCAAAFALVPFRCLSIMKSFLSLPRADSREQQSKGTGGCSVQ